MSVLHMFDLVVCSMGTHKMKCVGDDHAAGQRWLRPNPHMGRDRKNRAEID